MWDGPDIGPGTAVRQRDLSKANSCAEENRRPEVKIFLARCLRPCSQSVCDGGACGRNLLNSSIHGCLPVYEVASVYFNKVISS